MTEFYGSYLGFGGGGALPPVTVGSTASACAVATATEFTFSSQALGTAAANRKIVVTGSAGTGSSSHTVTAVTVGGVSGSLVVRSTGYWCNDMYIADVPTGTSGDIVVTFSESVGRASLGVWAIYGAASTRTDTASSQANPMTSGTGFTIPAGGAAIGCAFSAGGGATTHTWNAVLTEEFDTTCASVVGMSGASLATATALSTEITATPSSGTYFFSVFASWSKGA